MPQQNGDLFGDQFFPTPRPIAKRMLAKIKGDPKYYLEPSAGKGDICDVIRHPYTDDELDKEFAEVDEDNRERKRHIRRRFSEDRRVEIDVIEQHPDLVGVLRHKGYTVVGYDWLTYDGVSYYDCILGNPPFSEGARHLLKAWDFLYSGDIVFLLNEETIDNPYTEERKRLAAIIAAANGEVERLGPCFDTAERKTDVRVVMVHLKKTVPDDSQDMWAKEAGSEKVYNVEVGDDPNMLAIRDNLGNMEHWFNMANEHFCKAIDHVRRAMLYMNQNKIHDYQRHGNHESDFKAIMAIAFSNANSARSEFLRRHRKLAWTSVFNQMDFNRWLDSKQQEKFMRDVERDATIPFTAANIKGTLENVFLSRKKLFDESVAGVFDELTSHAVENCSGPEMPNALKNSYHRGEGWKTNDSYKVNERLIFPRGCRYDKDFTGFSTNYGGDAERIYSDLDRILSVLDCKNFKDCHTVGDALHNAFRSGSQTISRRSRFTSVADQVTESEYFEIRFFKKGTVHLKWKRLDLLEAFNRHAANGKKWIGENSQQYRPPVRKEYGDLAYRCRVDGCDYVNRVCSRCGGDDVDAILSDIPCELCRAVFEATGETYCPLHPKDAVILTPAPAPEYLQISAPEEVPFEEPWLFPELKYEDDAPACAPAM